MVKYFIDNNVNIHVKNEFALSHSTKNGYYDIVKILVNNGANIHFNNNCALNNSIESEYN